MAGSINKVILIGNLGANPEVRTTQTGSKVASFSLATSESWTDRTSGERKERTEWHRVVVFEQMADIAERFLTKGVKVYVEGQLRTRKWTDQDGQEHYVTEVVLPRFRGEMTMLSRPASGDTGGAGHAPHRRDSTPGQPDDEIPFAPQVS